LAEQATIWQNKRRFGTKQETVFLKGDFESSIAGFDTLFFFKGDFVT
jgi:hypothetical protein